MSIVCFEETINGRTFRIEVLAVERDRWRAQIARSPGATTAVMPFYGATPAEAAESLSQWLTRAAAGTSGPAEVGRYDARQKKT